MKIRILQKNSSKIEETALKKNLLKILQKLLKQSSPKTVSFFLSAIIALGIVSPSIAKTLTDTSDISSIDELYDLDKIPKNLLELLDISYYAIANKDTTINEDKEENIAILKKGEIVPIVETLTNGTSKILYNKKSFFVNQNDIEVYIRINSKDDDIPWIDNIYDFISEEKKLITTATVNLREKPNTKKNNKIYKLLDRNIALEYLGKYNNEWYEVLDQGKKAYVYSKYVKFVSSYKIKTVMKDGVISLSETELLDPISLKAIRSIPKNEFATVYAQTDKYYLVEVEGLIGYILKSEVITLGDDYIIIDITSQEIKVYKNDILIASSLIVTGDPYESPTYCGTYYIHKKEANYIMKVNGKGYPCDYYMAFNRDEALHDAAWRERKNEFGGITYKKDGSHGCVNLPHWIAELIYKSFDVKTVVHVKK